MIMISLLSMLKMVHLAGLMMGFGGAILVDFLILFRAILRPLRQDIVDIIERASRIVLSGLAILWISGAALVYYRVSADPQAMMNEKIWAKVAIVAILTINGVAVHRLALKHLAGRVGHRLFDPAQVLQTAGLTFIAAVSSVSWAVPFVLGVATELNFTVRALSILSVHAALVLLAWATMFTFVRGFSAAAPAVARDGASLAEDTRALRLRLAQVAANFAAPAPAAAPPHAAVSARPPLAEAEPALKLAA